MLTVQNLIEKLFYGELSNLSISERGLEDISLSDRKKLIHLINDSLTELHTRFSISNKELLVQSIEWKSLYLLDPVHAYMNPSDELKYILDTPNYEFTGDIIKILGVTNERGDPLPLNDAEQWASVFTPSYNELQLNHVGDEQVFNVTYQASHPKLSSEDGWLVQEIEIPPITENLLRTLVSYKFYDGMSGQDNSTKAQSHMTKYEYLCTEIDFKGHLNNSAMSSNVKLMHRGFP